jgi:hypothetical protein
MAQQELEDDSQLHDIHVISPRDWSYKNWPTKPGWRPRFATSRREPANGTGSSEVIVNLIAATTTRTGLRVQNQ